MAVYQFIYKKLSDIITNYHDSNKTIRIGFGERHVDNFAEMTAHPSDLKIHWIDINARHVSLFPKGMEAVVCVEDYKNKDVSDECFDLLTAIAEEFTDDFIDDEHSRWKFFILDSESKNIYELDITSIQILTVQEEAVIHCKNCKKRLM